MFGAKSEKRLEASPDLIALFNARAAAPGAVVPKVVVPAHERHKHRTDPI
jgi:hypothetical protein